MTAVETNLDVARAILVQLGGPRFRIMVGAKNFVGSADGLSFQLPRNFAQKGITAVSIKLEPTDTYTVEFLRVYGGQRKVIAAYQDVYCDQLQDLFTRETGLHTSL